MRIGMMTDVYFPHVSGITNHISLTKRVLENAGHKVFIFTFGDLEYEDEELHVIRSPGVALADTGYHIGVRLSSVARRKLKTMDLVHVHHPFLSGRLALRYCQPENIPVVFTNHTRYDLYAQAYLPVLADQLGVSFLQLYMPSFCSAVDLVVAPSEGVRRVMVDFGIESPIEVIPNGVNLDVFRREQQPVARQALGYQDSDILLIYAGRLGPEKNLTFLLRAFAGAQAAIPQARLLLVGDGPERDNLEDLVRGRGLSEVVYFAGMLPYEQLPAHLAAADAFITASVTEVHPLSVIEALAAGLPVIGIDSPGVGDCISDGIDGVLSADDLAEFTARLTRFLSNPEERALLASRTKQSAERFEIQRTVGMLEARYQQLISHPRRRKRWNPEALMRRIRDRIA